MRQSRFSLLGVLLLGVPVAFAAVFGWRATVEQWTMPLMVLAGVLAVLAGRVAAVEVGSVRVSWRHLLATTYVLTAVSFPLSQRAVTGPGSTESYVLLGATVMIACSLLFFAVDIARDGRHIEITPDVDRVLSL